MRPEDDEHGEDLMADPTSEFFERLTRGRPQMLSDKIEATMRFDLEHDGRTDHWLMAIDKGTVRVSRERRDADVVIRATKGLFDRLVTGEVAMVPAMWRNELTFDGDARLSTTLRKLLPPPPGATDPGAAARGRGGPR